MRKMSKLLMAAFCAALVFTVGAMHLEAKKLKALKVGFTAIVEHPALDAVRQGAIDALKKDGFDKQVNFVFESAQGNPTIAVQIAKKFAGMNLDLIVPISTPSAQAVISNIKNKPVVFSAVTDPVKAGIVSSLEKPGGMVTGVSDLAPMSAHMQLLKDFMPGIKKVGVLYNPGEVNSVVTLNTMKEVAPQFGIQIVEAAAPKSSDVLAAAQSLIGKVDAIYIPTDNTVVSALESVISVGIKTRTPVFSGDTSSVERGAIAAVGFDYYDVGLQTGKIASKILQGEKPGSIDVEFVENMNMFVNVTAAKKMGLDVSQELIDRAKKVIR